MGRGKIVYSHLRESRFPSKIISDVLEMVLPLSLFSQKTTKKKTKQNRSKSIYSRIKKIDFSFKMAMIIVVTTWDSYYRWCPITYESYMSNYVQIASLLQNLRDWFASSVSNTPPSSLHQLCILNV